MSLRGFARAGHMPTLIAALLYFDVSFMTWVLLGPLARGLKARLTLLELRILAFISFQALSRCGHARLGQSQGADVAEQDLAQCAVCRPVAVEENFSPRCQATNP